MVTFYLAKEIVPFKAVDNKGLMYTFDACYDLPSRKYFSNTAIPHMYSECRQRITAQIKHDKFFAPMSDLWSSHTSETYLSLTSNFIDDWKLKSECLQTNYCPENHTGELIANNLKKALESKH